jgi:iron complex outermembrane receptor protein
MLMLFLLSIGLHAQEESQDRDTVYHLPPVIVTATHAKERETPVSFSSMRSEQIRSTYMMHDVPSVLSELPSTVHYSWEGNDIGYSFLTMRGFEQRRIAVMINGVPQNDPEDHNVFWIDMPDLLNYTESVQVQRGAGSAFYGPPAIGGSINLVTTPVSVTPRVTLTSLFGFQEYGDEGRTVLNTRKYGLSIHSGLIDGKYFLYGNLSSIRSSGYRQLAGTDLRSYFLGAARFDEAMTTRIHVFGGPVDHGLAYYGIPKFYNTQQLRRTNYNFFLLNPAGDSVVFSSPRKLQEHGAFFQPHYEILHEWKLSPSLTLSNTLFYILGNGAFDYDGDWVWVTPPAAQWMRTYVGYDSTQTPSMILQGFVGNKQWGWLPRIEIEHEDGKLTLGGELRIHRSQRWGKIQYASEFPSSAYDPDFHFYEYNGEKDMASVYAHEVYRMNERTTLMADLQFAYNRYGLTNEKFLGTSFSVPYYFVNPRLGINYNVSEELNMYLSLGYTSREPRLFDLYNGEEAWLGGTPAFDTLVSGVYDFDKPLAKPERLLNVEFGGGYIFTDGRLTANIFWMEFFDELIRSGNLDIFGRPVTGNAKRTRHMGVEFTYRQKVIAPLEVSANLTLSRNRLVEYQVYDALQATSLDGNPISGFPDVLGNLRLAYHVDRFRTSLLMKHVGAFYTDNRKDDNNKVDAYTVFDVDATCTVPFADAEIVITGRVRNLFNTLYFAGGEGDRFFPAAERSYIVGLNVGF